MKVCDVMSRDVCLAKPDDTLQTAAKQMADMDIGFLPVDENDRLIGTITDRDIVVRCVAKGEAATAKVRDAMTNDVKYCFEDDDLDRVMKNMGDQKLRRLPVVNRNKRLVGIISIGDTARGHDVELAGAALRGVTESGGPHSQASH
jgi:CBS domain-containing protein